MEKSVSSKEYELFLNLLRDVRQRSGLSQADLANRLGETQSFVSKCERRERRLDVIELRAWCLGLDTPFPAFFAELDELLKSSKTRH